MKNIWIWIVLVVVVLAGLAYLGRRQIKSMLGMTPTPAPVVTTAMTPSPSATPSAMAVVMPKNVASKGAYLTDSKGMSLYVFDKDTKGVSNCTGSCATLWPPYVSSSAAATTQTNITTVKRADGSMQYAYNGMPLYYYAKDKAAGDTLGDGVGGVWHLAKPQ